MAFQIYNIYIFSVLIFSVQLISYFTVGPINNALLWCLAYKDRPLGIAINILMIHAFGDALAPFIIAFLISFYKNNYKLFFIFRDLDSKFEFVL